MRNLLASLVLAAAALGGGVAAAPGAGAASALPPIKHVWVVELENKSYAEALNGAKDFLGTTLPSLGQVLTHFYATGHASLDNYVAQVSGQAPNLLTQTDCVRYMDVLPGVIGPGGQAIGEGCVYPTAVKTIADQLSAAHLTWKGYMEDMGNSPTRDHTTVGTCGHPVFNTTDGTQTATSGDQYATRHNPFVYFHTIIDSPAQCRNVVSLKPLATDLASVATTPNFSWITPNLCNDGHDTGCAGPDVAGKKDGGLTSTNRWLAKYVPMIMASPAYKANGMIVVTWDESETSDASSCCGAAAGPGSPLPGIGGSGGGHIAAVVLSPFVKPGSTNPTSYNHYAMLRSIEDIFGVGHLAAAGASGLKAFGSDVFNAAPPPAATHTAATVTSPGAAGAAEPVPSAVLPVTGGDNRWAVAAAALGVGLLLLIVRRRSRVT